MTDHVPNDLSHLSDEEFNALCPQGEHAPGPATTDFRALCEELNGLLEYISDISPHLCEDEINNLTNSARAALAEPPSLKEQALKELKDWTDEKHGPGGEVFLCEGLNVAIIRRALGALPND